MDKQRDHSSDTGSLNNETHEPMMVESARAVGTDESPEVKLSTLEKVQRNPIGRSISRVCLSLIGYTILLTIFVVFSQSVTSVKLGVDIEDPLVTANATGFLYASTIGVFLFSRLRKGHFWKEDVPSKNKKMTADVFFKVLPVFLAGQLLFTGLDGVIEAIANQFGMTFKLATESATAGSTTISMFLYAGFFAPVTEELIFRGAILRYLERYGKVFAIVMSSVLFGLFHMNLVQGLFAFSIGLVMAYVAVEYSLFWAIFLHMFNNLFMGDILGTLLGLLPEPTGNMIYFAIITFACIYGLFILYTHRRLIQDFLDENQTPKGTYKKVLTSPVFWIFVILCIWSSFALIQPL